MGRSGSGITGRRRCTDIPKRRLPEKPRTILLRTVFPRPLSEIDAELLRKGRWEGELTRTTRDGTPLAVATHWVLKRDKNGLARGVMEISNDITEHKRADEEIQKSKRLLEMFVENAPAGLAMFDRNMRYVRVSKKWHEDTRLEDGAILGKSHYEISLTCPNIGKRRTVAAWRENR